MDQDFLLIGKMRHGDEEAMELFVRKYYPQVLKYCSFHSGDTQKTWHRKRSFGFSGRLQAILIRERA